MNRQIITVNDREIALSNPGKDLYPSYGFTKARIVEYYSRIAHCILPHLKDRAITLKCYPDGVEKDWYYEKRCPSHRPGWIQTAQVPYGSEKTLAACMINDLQALIWVENLASIELHVPLAKAHSPAVPDSVVFDLDPGEGADILDCAAVALMLKTMFDGLDLASWVKTSGKKGLHVYVPINSPETGFDTMKNFSKAVALTMEKNFPDLVTAKMNKETRKKRVFINWSQNDASKTMVCVYSLRAEPKPTVSFPLTWKELEDLHRRKDPEKFVIMHDEAISRAEKQGDIFAAVLQKKQKLPES